LRGDGEIDGHALGLSLEPVTSRIPPAITPVPTGLASPRFERAIVQRTRRRAPTVAGSTPVAEGAGAPGTPGRVDVALGLGVRARRVVPDRGREGGEARHLVGLGQPRAQGEL